MDQQAGHAWRKEGKGFAHEGQRLWAAVEWGCLWNKLCDVQRSLLRARRTDIKEGYHVIPPVLCRPQSSLLPPLPRTPLSLVPFTSVCLPSPISFQGCDYVLTRRNPRYNYPISMHQYPTVLQSHWTTSHSKNGSTSPKTGTSGPSCMKTSAGK